MKIVQKNIGRLAYTENRSHTALRPVNDFFFLSASAYVVFIEIRIIVASVCLIYLKPFEAFFSINFHIVWM